MSDDYSEDNGGDEGIYGQPADAYVPYSEVFAQALLQAPEHVGGLKFHISVATEHADPLARVVLPTLRLVQAHHKVVRPNGAYIRMNAGNQRGKFITIYSGDTGPSLRVLSTIDPVLRRLRSEGIRPGPLPMIRQGGHTEFDRPFGHSGMISYYWVDDYRRDTGYRR